MPISEPSWRTKSKKRKGKREAILKDPTSTGRKRAKKLYPIPEGMICEWSYETLGIEDEGEAAIEVQHISGSKKIIPACRAGLAKHRHHGPDKNTLNNEKGNVHRICHSHHNVWHALNDKDWDGKVRDD